MTDEELSIQFLNVMAAMADRAGGLLRGYFDRGKGMAGNPHYLYFMKEIWTSGDYYPDREINIRFSMIPHVEPFLPERPKYDYESTAEEIVELPEQRKELTDGTTRG